VTQPLGLLIAGFDYANAAADEFHDWYDTEHVPERLAMRGFLNAERWLDVENPKIALATYDLESSAVLDDPVYVAAKGPKKSPWSQRMGRIAHLFCRIVADQLGTGNAVAPQGAGALLMFAMNVAPEAEADFNAWYDQEHLPMLASLPGVLRARRFRASVGDRRYVALYHLSAPEVTATDGWKASRHTDWAKRIGPSTRDHQRILLRRYERESRP